MHTKRWKTSTREFQQYFIWRLHLFRSHLRLNTVSTDFHVYIHQCVLTSFNLKALLEEAVWSGVWFMTKTRLIGKRRKNAYTRFYLSGSSSIILLLSKKLYKYEAYWRHSGTS